MNPQARIGVVGGGAWGTALAIVAAAGGCPTPLWLREGAAEVSRTRGSPRLSGIALLDAVHPTEDVDALADCDALLIAVPASATAAMLARIAGQRPRPLVLCAKGLDPSGAPLAEVAAAALPGWPVALLSGPTFAHEVARGLPAAATLACRDANLGVATAARLASPAFRIYATSDVIGVGVGGAVKNVLAIAAGIAAGRALGDSARAAIITRGFAEMLRYGAAMGADAATLGGLSGLGDLVLTCTGPASRNFALGFALGRGSTATDALAASDGVAEGAATAPILSAAAARHGIDLPITAAVADLLAGRTSVDDAIARLLARPPRAEN